MYSKITASLVAVVNKCYPGPAFLKLLPKPSLKDETV
jgi:hypothetical protein